MLISVYSRLISPGFLCVCLTLSRQDIQVGFDGVGHA